MKNQQDADEFEVLLASDVDRDDLRTEIWHRDRHVAEVRWEGGDVRIDLFAEPGGGAWDFDFSAFTSALERARRRLRASADQELD